MTTSPPATPPPMAAVDDLPSSLCCGLPVPGNSESDPFRVLIGVRIKSVGADTCLCSDACLVLVGVIVKLVGVAARL